MDALHELHHRAGWPSLRTIARNLGCSPTTVSAVFSRPRLPAWGLLELVVEDLGGDCGEFHALWVAAGSPDRDDTGTQGATPLAGRKDDVRAVRAHFDRGDPGLLLVCGEAGIGKSRLVATVVSTAAPDLTVLRGSCAPLATAAPFLPWVDVLRAAYAVDDGQWLKEALAAEPAYVAGEIVLLLPELDAGPPVPDSWREPEPPSAAGQLSPARLFAAVRTALTGLAALRPLTMVIEDLHWADAATLDLLEHLLRSPVGLGVPVVATYRTDDPATSPSAEDWQLRVRRLPGVAVQRLEPLDLDGTREQLELLTGAPVLPGRAEAIHRRSAGNPLFTEQLAAQSDHEAGTDAAAVPRLLTDLLDQRIRGLDDDAWSVACVLAAGDRPITGAQLSEVAGVPDGDLTAGLRSLDRRRLLSTGPSKEITLSHPLIAESVRRRSLPIELADAQRRLADAMAAWPGVPAAEIAGLWCSVGDPDQEAPWRVRAAQSAASTHAAHLAADHWLRLLEIWPRVRDVERIGARLVSAHLEAIVALEASGRVDQAIELSRQAL
ncbi:MAG TPA: AAA family ATPase, partial [Nocardioides sp.]